jgi:hypothetical protein
MKLEALAGVAVRVTIVPLARVVPQALPQAIPPTSEVTVPPPLPVVVIPKGYVCARACWGMARTAAIPRSTMPARSHRGTARLSPATEAIVIPSTAPRVDLRFLPPYSSNALAAISHAGTAGSPALLRREEIAACEVVVWSASPRGPA